MSKYYNLVECITSDELDYEVTKLLDKGWELYGSPIVHSYKTCRDGYTVIVNLVFAQAMTYTQAKVSEAV